MPPKKDSYFGWGVCEPEQVASILNGSGYGHYIYSNGYSNMYPQEPGQKKKTQYKQVDARAGNTIEMYLDLGSGKFMISIEGELIVEKKLVEKKLVPFLMVKHQGTGLTTKIIK